jgi:sugar fermentation stimulation protein A
MPALVAARFVARPNRFIVMARLENGDEVRCHMADPGRLRELLLPDVELRLRPAPADAVRATRYSVALVRAPMAPRPWVSLDTTLPNRLAAVLLREGRIRGLGGYEDLQAEVRHGKSRIDFLLTPRRGEKILVEVKSVTLVEDGVALFPDAPTVRGTRHLQELTAHVEAGGRGAVLFVVQRPDARAVRARRVTDPAFADALAAARAGGVLLRAVHFRLRGDGAAGYVGSLPVQV